MRLLTNKHHTWVQPVVTNSIESSEDAVVGEDGGLKIGEVLVEVLPKLFENVLDDDLNDIIIKPTRDFEVLV